MLRQAPQRWSRSQPATGSFATMHPGQEHQPPLWQRQQPKQSSPWQQQRRYPQSQQRGPRHQQFKPWASWEGPPPQQQHRNGAPHQRRQQHRGGDQSHWHQRRMCQRCGEEEHFPAECRVTTPAPVPQHRPYAASSSGAHVAQYGTCLPPPWTSHDSDGHSTASSYGPPPPHDSYAPATPIPPPPRPNKPPPPASPSESYWSFSSGHSQALQAYYVPPGEFSSSVSSDWRTNGDSVGGSYLPSAFVGQPVDIDQVGDVWIDDSGAASHMTRSADLMYDTRPPSPHRSRIIQGDGSIKKVQFVGKLDKVFHSRTHYPVTPHGVSYVPNLGFNLFSFHVVQEKHNIILNKTGAHLLGGRLVFPRRCNGSSLRATRVLPGGNANASTALPTFVEPPSHRSDGPPSPLPNSSVISSAAHQNSGVSSSCRTSNAGTGTGEKRSDVVWGMGRGPGSILSNNAGMAAAVLSPGDVFIKKKKKKWSILTTSTLPLPTPIRVC